MEEQRFSIMTDVERRRAAKPTKGFVVDFKKWAAMKTDASPFALEAAALQALSLSAGDTVVLPPLFGSEPVYMNLYIMMIGPSTTMRKTTVLNFIRDILPVNDQTGDGYIKFMDDVSIQAFNREVARAGKTQSPVILSVDEIAGLFQLVRNKSGSYLAGFDKTLLRVYDHTPIYIARVGRKIESNTGAFVNIFAASTPEPLLEVLDSDDVESGLLPRFIIFDVRDAQRGERRTLMARLQQQDEWEDIKHELQRHLAEIAVGRACGMPKSFEGEDMKFERTEMKFTLEALERLDELDEKFSNEVMHDTTAIAAIKGRGFWQVVKLAGLYALSRKGRRAKVELIDVLHAMYLVEETVSDLLNMKDEVGANELERRILAVEQMLKSTAQREMKQSTILRRLKLSSWESKDLMGTLGMRGLVTTRKIADKNDYVWKWVG